MARRLARAVASGLAPVGLVFGCEVSDAFSPSTTTNPDSGGAAGATSAQSESAGGSAGASSPLATGGAESVAGSAGGITSPMGGGSGSAATGAAGMGGSAGTGMLFGPDGAAPIVDTPIVFDAPDAVAPMGCQGADCECSQFEFMIDTKQSCALDLKPATADPGALPLDAESFIELENEQFRVLAMDRWGAGHLLAWCDGTTFDEVAKQIPLFEYLGQVSSPRIASVGYEYFCGERHVSGDDDYGFDPSDVTYLGTAIPAQYLDDPAALAGDWDGLILCATNGFASAPEYADTVRRFVSEFGRGLALVGEYSSTAADQANVSQYVLGTGIEFVPISLDWAPAAAAVDLDCVADVPPIIR